MFISAAWRRRGLRAPLSGSGKAAEDVLQERRQTLILRYWLGLPPAEIGELLGVPEGTVRSRLARALRDLRSLLQERDVEPARGTAAAAAEAALALRDTGAGRRHRRGGAAVAVERPDVLARAYAALEVPPHSILRDRIVTTTGLGCRQVVERWIATDQPYRFRSLTTGPSRSEEGFLDGRWRFYDAVRRVIVESPDQRVTATSVLTSFTFTPRVRQLLAQGEGHVEGTAVVAGRSVYRIAVPNGDVQPLVIAVDARTFEPVPDTAANRALLDIAARKPGAGVERTPTLRAYTMAETRAAGSRCGL